MDAQPEKDGKKKGKQKGMDGYEALKEGYVPRPVRKAKMKLDGELVD
jgi:hypothetical protein